VYEKTSTFNASILGTEDFLSVIKRVLNKNGITSSEVVPEKSNAFRISIYGQKNLGRLFDYLYTDSNVFLERKREKFMKALMYYDVEFNAVSETAKLFLSVFDDNLIDLKIRRHIGGGKVDLRSTVV
jgi:hypothetical protein